MLSCAGLNHFESDDILKISDLLAEWCCLVKISNSPSGSSKTQIMVDIATGSAPHFTKLFSPSQTTIPCYLQIDALLEKLVSLIVDKIKEEQIIKINKMTLNPLEVDILDKREIQTNSFLQKSGLNSKKIEFLIAAWSGYLYEENKIDEIEIPIELCIGFKDIHFYLSGAKSLNDFLGTKSSLSIVFDTNEDKDLLEKNRLSDLWSNFFSGKVGDVDFKKTPAEYNFQHHFEAINLEEYNESHPRWYAKMTEVTQRSCSVTWEITGAPLLELGQLVALRKGPNDHWQLGEIDWKVRLDDSKIKTGIRIISTQAIPVGIDLPSSLNENYVEAILTPPEEMLGALTSFISPPHGYQKDDYVSVSQKDIEEKVKIYKLMRKNTYYERCECAFAVKKITSGAYKSA